MLADEFDDALADAGTIDDEFIAAVGDGGMPREGGDEPGDIAVGRAERDALEEADRAQGFLFPLIGDAVLGAGDNLDALDDGDGGVVMDLADVDADVVSGIGRGGDALARAIFRNSLLK